MAKRRKQNTNKRKKRRLSAFKSPPGGNLVDGLPLASSSAVPATWQSKGSRVLHTFGSYSSNVKLTKILKHFNPKIVNTTCKLSATYPQNQSPWNHELVYALGWVAAQNVLTFYSSGESNINRWSTLLNKFFDRKCFSDFDRCSHAKFQSIKWNDFGNRRKSINSKFLYFEQHLNKLLFSCLN